MNFPGPLPCLPFHFWNVTFSWSKGSNSTHLNVFLFCFWQSSKRDQNANTDFKRFQQSLPCTEDDVNKHWNIHIELAFNSCDHVLQSSQCHLHYLKRREKCIGFLRGTSIDQHHQSWGMTITMTVGKKNKVSFIISSVWPVYYFGILLYYLQWPLTNVFWLPFTYLIHNGPRHLFTDSCSPFSPTMTPPHSTSLLSPISLSHSQCAPPQNQSAGSHSRFLTCNGPWWLSADSHFSFSLTMGPSSKPVCWLLHIS